MRSFILASLLLAMLAAPAATQETTSPPESDTRALVTYTIAGRLDAPAEPGAVPVDLLVLLAREPHLARLGVGEGGGPHDFVEAVFVFPTAEAFRSWYESEEGRSVVRALSTRLLEPSSRLGFRRVALSRLLPG